MRTIASCSPSLERLYRATYRSVQHILMLVDGVRDLLRKTLCETSHLILLALMKEYEKIYNRGGV